MGLSICEHLVRRGDAAAVFDVKGAEETAQKLRAQGGRAFDSYSYVKIPGRAG